MTFQVPLWPRTHRQHLPIYRSPHLMRNLISDEDPPLISKINTWIEENEITYPNLSDNMIEFALINNKTDLSPEQIFIDYISELFSNPDEYNDRELSIILERITPERPAARERPSRWGGCCRCQGGGGRLYKKKYHKLKKKKTKKRKKSKRKRRTKIKL